MKLKDRELLQLQKFLVNKGTTLNEPLPVILIRSHSEDDEETGSDKANEQDLSDEEHGQDKDSEPEIQVKRVKYSHSKQTESSSGYSD